MKHKLLGFITVLITIIFLTACGGDNAYDGTGLNAVQSTSGESDALSSIQQNIMIANSSTFTNALNNLESSLKAYENNLTVSDVVDLQNSFTSIVQKWKAVEVTYVAGDYDSALIDTPRLIEFFIKASKNQDIPAEVQDALEDTGNIKTALFKNTSKSMQALEYLIFDKQKSPDALVGLMNKNEKRRIEALKVVVENLLIHANTISDFYSNDTQFIAEQTDALNALVNALVQSTFDLREKRIGEQAGFVIATKDNPDATAIEYYNSQNSMTAIKAILEAHKQIMGASSFENLGSFSSSNGASNIVTQIRANIDNSLALANEIGNLETAINADPINPKLKALYDELQVLENNYFSSLINSLDLTAKIIDADGD